jgi:hypothetical protein
MLKRLYFSLVLVFGQYSLSSAKAEHECFPQSSLRIPRLTRGSDPQKDRMDRLIKEFEKKNVHLTGRFLSKKLKIEHLWEEDRVNALATFDLDDYPVIQVMGGISRYPQISDDAIRLILCHELGHFIGGLPKKLKGNSEIPSWSSAEGQADYFSTAVCFKNYERQNTPAKVSLEVQNICAGDQDCLRISQASQELMSIWAKLKASSKIPNLLERDLSFVAQTNLNYPSLQCRLDTMVNGARCSHLSDEYLKKTEIVCHEESEQTLRPNCWFFE